MNSVCFRRVEQAPRARGNAELMLRIHERLLLALPADLHWSLCPFGFFACWVHGDRPRAIASSCTLRSRYRYIR